MKFGRRSKIDTPVPGGKKVDGDPIDEGDELKDHQNHQKLVEWSLQLEMCHLRN